MIINSRTTINLRIYEQISEFTTNLGPPSNLVADIDEEERMDDVDDVDMEEPEFKPKLTAHETMQKLIMENMFK